MWSHIRRGKPFFQKHHTCITGSGSIFSSFENIPTRSCFFKISKCACMRYLSAEYCCFLKNWPQNHKKHHTYVYHLTVISSFIQNFFQKIPTISILFFESMCWMLVDASIFPEGISNVSFICDFMLKNICLWQLKHIWLLFYPKKRQTCLIDIRQNWDRWIHKMAIILCPRSIAQLKPLVYLFPRCF